LGERASGEDGSVLAEHADEPATAPQRYTSRGAIPPVGTTESEPLAPSASDRAFAADAIPTADIMYEEMAHRMIYQDQLGDLDRLLLARWGFRAEWVPLHGKLGLFCALFVPAKAGVSPVVAFRGMQMRDKDDVLTVLEPKVGNRQWVANRDAIASLLAHAGGPCVATGHSLGGGLAQMAAAELPGMVSRVVAFQSPGISHEMAQHFEQQAPSERAQVSYHDGRHDIVDLGGQEHLPGTRYSHLPAQLGFGLSPHVGYLLISPQYAAQRRALGLDDATLDLLDAIYHEHPYVLHHVHEQTEVHAPTVTQNYPHPTAQVVMDKIREVLAAQLARFPSVQDALLDFVAKYAPP
jgi:pimeloyl-ACP methyl ester carboxylesterase